MGEWFRLNIDDISSFKEICEKFKEIIDLMKDNSFFIKKLR